ARRQPGQPREGQFVALVADQLEIGGDVFDMRLIEEAGAAGNAEGDVAAGEFQLQLERVKVRAVQLRHLVQVGPFLAQRERALRDKSRLLSGPCAGDKRRL